MTPLVSWLNAYAAELLNLWSAMQVQTTVFVLLVWLVERALPREWATPRLRYLLWSTVLLKAVIPPVLAFPGVETLPIPAFALAPVEAMPGMAVPAAGSGFPYALALMLTIAAVSLALAAVAGWRAMDLRRLLRGAVPFSDLPAGEWPPVFVSHRIPSPLATGIRHPRIFITPSIATAPRDILLAVLQHERAHIRRRDGVMVVVQTLVQIAYVLNPLVWMANLRIFRYRELICDEEALVAAGTRPQDYGRLLVDFAEAQPARILQTGTCFFETRRGFVERISELFSLGTRQTLRWKHYAAVVIVALLILPLSWQCGDPSSEADVKEPITHESTIPVSADDYDPNVDQAAEIIGGLDAIRQNLEYPEDAMRKGIQGMVIVQVIVGKDGRGSGHEVLKGQDPGLDQAALDAVKTLRFKPAAYRGDTRVSTLKIPIKFKLQ
ncbi:MAG: M56 family metallopeptidase [Bacteroidetes bacterium]|nr:M56 family metallopeptidase [Bacteroidota bacterium]